MSIITYPLDGVTYSAEDVAAWLCTRTSGVYAKESNYAVSITGARQLTVAPGLAWINYDDFKGVGVCSREAVTLTVPEADSTLPRIDRIVLQFDTDANLSALKLKPGTPAASPAAPQIQQNHRVYELGLATLAVPAGTAAVTAANLTDTRLDEDLCGVMSDGVTGIPTAQLLAQARAVIHALEETASQSAQDAASSASRAAGSESAAAASAKDAAASEAAALLAAEDAAGSASAAKTDAEAAAAKADAADTSAKDAAASKTAAGQSAEDAATAQERAEAAASRAAAIVGVDPTLTVEGAPADAKATGDALAAKADDEAIRNALKEALAEKLGLHDTAEDSTKWAGRALRLEHNTSDTWIPVFCEGFVDYVLKSEIVPAKLGQSGNPDIPMQFNWSGQNGQPTWLWGGNDGTNMYVYNPSNFSVNYANNAGNGVNASGSNYIRFACGVQICWTSSLNATSDWTFPAAFSNTNYAVTAIPQTYDAYCYGGKIATSTRCSTTKCRVYGKYMNNGNLIMAIAIGRWY